MPPARTEVRAGSCLRLVLMGYLKPYRQLPTVPPARSELRTGSYLRLVLMGYLNAYAWLVAFLHKARL